MICTVSYTHLDVDKRQASEDEVTDKTIVDAAGLRVLPGLVDIHSHGAFGHDFSDADPEGLKIILKYEKSHGITSYCPTSMTLPAEELKEIFATIKTCLLYTSRQMGGVEQVLAFAFLAADVITYAVVIILMSRLDVEKHIEEDQKKIKENQKKAANI